MIKHGRLDPRTERLIDRSGECWIWLGARDRQGYAKGSGKLQHRVVYERFIGPIPDGLELDHLCRNVACVRPDHLEPVTRAENMRRRYAVMTSCKNGHEFTPENTRIWNGHRHCRKCVAAHSRAYALRQKEAKA